MRPSHPPTPTRAFIMMLSSQCQAATLPVNRIWLLTEVGQHIQVPQGILVLQENRRAAGEHLAMQSAGLASAVTETGPFQSGVLGLLRSRGCHLLSATCGYLHALPPGETVEHKLRADGAAETLL